MENWYRLRQGSRMLNLDLFYLSSFVPVVVCVVGETATSQSASGKIWLWGQGPDIVKRLVESDYIPCTKDDAVDFVAEIKARVGRRTEMDKLRTAVQALKSISQWSGGLGVPWPQEIAQNALKEIGEV